MSRSTKRPSFDSAAIFEQYQPLANRLAGKYAAKYGMPVQSLIDEAQSQLGLLAARWNIPGDDYFYSGVVSPITWIYRNLSWRLIEFCTRRQPRYATFSNTNREAVAEVAKASARPSWWETLLANLGEDARVLVATLCNAPADLAADLSPRRAGTRGKPAAAAHMAGRGWDEARFERAWWEVAGAL